MKATYIYPSDIGASSEWSSEWIVFIKKFGFIDGTPWPYLILTNIEIV